MQIDHVELFVPDRAAACQWYGEWLGFAAMPQHAEWVKTGPLMITNDGGSTMLALFEGEPPRNQDVRGWRRVAWRLDGEAFSAWTAKYRQSGQSLAGPIDHEKAWSVYFSDPWGNALEVTTYDYALVTTAQEVAT